MYVLIQDSAGQEQKVVHPNPATTQIDQWTEWQIPLSDLTAVDLSQIGNRTANCIFP